MQPVTLPAELRTNLNLPNEGALLILSVEAEAPAGRGGLMLGDVLLTLEGAPVADTDDVQTVLSRSQQQHEITLTLAERPGEKTSDYDEPGHRWKRPRWRR